MIQPGELLFVILLCYTKSASFQMLSLFSVFGGKSNFMVALENLICIEIIHIQ